MLAKRKGPFPGGKRVGSWGKKGKEKEKEKESHLGKYWARNITHEQRGYLGRWLLPRKVPCVRTLLR